MYFCYIDESGTSEQPGTSSHFVLAGLAVPVEHWKSCERSVVRIKREFDLLTAEIHSGWMLRKYPEQDKIDRFEQMSREERLEAVTRARLNELYRLQTANPKQYRQTKRTYQNTLAYAHLTYDQRRAFVGKIASEMAGWPFCTLFAECIDKTGWTPSGGSYATINDQAFQEVVARFDQYLHHKNIHKEEEKKRYGLLIHDNNQTIAKKHTELLNHFQAVGTLWTKIEHIIETPLFVESGLTSMVQLADLASYALRRYLENQEDELFDIIFPRADRRGKKVVGVRHWHLSPFCPCRICAEQ